MDTKRYHTLTFRLQWTLLAIMAGFYSQAQEMATIELAPIEITENRLSEFAVGSKTMVFDSTVLALEPVPSLSNLIGQFTLASIKSYGNGMLASISFRGTGPSHTAVLWHGLNVGYPMLGQTDLSLFNLAMNDHVVIQHGTGSALYGSGAIGGTISLTSDISLKGLQVSLSQWAGTFGTYLSRLQVRGGSQRFFWNISTYRDASENDFSYINTTKPGLPSEKQQNAAYQMLGVGIEAGVLLNNRARIEVSGQYSFADRNLQPPMNVEGPTDVQKDNNLRLRSAYIFDGDRMNTSAQYAFFKDRIEFNGKATDVEQHILRVEWDILATDKLKLNLAADQNFVEVAAPFYKDSSAIETRTNLWASALLMPTDKLLVSASLRKAFHSLYEVPLSPALGLEYELPSNTNNGLRLKFQASRGFRVPTLNELYWEPGGNPDLLAEDNYSTEIGLTGSYTKDVRVKYSFTGYRMWVENWILWRPVGTWWSPENIKQVDVYGLEADFSLEHKLGPLQMHWLSNYGFTRSINRTALDAFDRSVGKQLAYVPMNKANLTLTTVWQKWSMSLNTSFTGKRYTTADNESSLSAYTLLNLRAARQFEWHRITMSAHVAINNLLNTSYQSIENRAMPGLNALIGIKIIFKEQ